MRILFIVIQFAPDVNSTGQLMAELGEQLAEKGHQVSVVTSFPHYQDFRIDAANRGRLFQRDRLRSMDVLRLWVYAPGRKSMLNRLINYLSFAVGAAIAGLLWRKSWDVILCTNGSFFSGIAAWFIGAIKRIPFIYNVQDLYPEVPVEAGHLRNRYAIEILKRIESFMYRKARHVTVISPAMRGNLLGKNLPAEKIALIPNFVNGDFIRPLPRSNDFSRAQALDGKFVVMHAGNLGYVYDFESLLQAAKALESDRDIVFLIVGDGVAKQSLEHGVTQLRLKNLSFLPFFPREQLPWLRATADVQVCLYKHGAARHSMPSKIYEIMASGRPVLASAERESALWQLVDETNCGLCIDPEQPGQLAEAIMKLRADATLRNHLGANGRRWAEQAYSKVTAAAAYEALMQGILGDPLGNPHQAKELTAHSPRTW